MKYQESSTAPKWPLIALAELARKKPGILPSPYAVGIRGAGGRGGGGYSGPTPPPTLKDPDEFHPS